MKKKIICAFLCATLIFTFAGCGNKNENSGESSQETTDDSSSENEAESSVEAADPNISGPSTEEAKGTESTKSEGLNTAPGTVVDLTSDAIEGKIGETINVSESDPRFTLSMDEVALTDTRTDMQEADRVVAITYTYKNLDSSSLLIGQYSFRVLNEDGEACEIYYFDPSETGISSASPVDKDGTCTATLGFIVGDTKNVTVVYDDQTGNSDTELYWTVNLE